MNRSSVHTMARLAAIVVLAATAGCAGAATPTSSTPAAPATFEVTGRVVDAAAGTAINGVTMSAMNGPNLGKSARTGADGRYTLAGLTAGSFTLKAQSTGFEDYLQEITVTNNTNF